jgi:hypothetical protein
MIRSLGILMVAGCAFVFGCAEPCSTTGTGSLVDFELDCGAVEFLGSGDVLTLTLPDEVDGQIDLTMFNIVTLGPGNRFGDGGDYTLEGNYHASGVSVAPVDSCWVEITDWVAVEDESWSQEVAIDFFVEVEPTSTFNGGTVEGSATAAQVFLAD